MKYVSLDKMIEHMKVTNITPDIDTSSIKITVPEINRPALQLAGFFSRYTNERVQVIGIVEFEYLMSMNEDQRHDSFKRLVSTVVPCVVFTSSNRPDEVMMNIAKQYRVPLLLTSSTTSKFTAEVIRWLSVQLAPTISVHGVLIDVFGEGVLITGESGIGKSEAALELIKRGHRLVSDDVVELHKVSDITLVGTSPDITKHFIELRGIGIIDVKTLYGIESVEDTHSIDLVIKLEEWDKDKEYDRLGIEEQKTEYMGINVTSHSIPIRPGRNLAIIVETAAVNHRQRRMGYNAAQELYRRVQDNLMKRRGDSGGTSGL